MKDNKTYIIRVHLNCSITRQEVHGLWLPKEDDDFPSYDEETSLEDVVGGLLSDISKSLANGLKSPEPTNFIMKKINPNIYVEREEEMNVFKHYKQFIRRLKTFKEE